VIVVVIRKEEKESEERRESEQARVGLEVKVYASSSRGV